MKIQPSEAKFITGESGWSQEEKHKAATLESYLYRKDIISIDADVNIQECNNNGNCCC